MRWERLRYVYTIGHLQYLFGLGITQCPIHTQGRILLQSRFRVWYSIICDRVDLHQHTFRYVIPWYYHLCHTRPPHCDRAIPRYRIMSSALAERESDFLPVFPASSWQSLTPTPSRPALYAIVQVPLSPQAIQDSGCPMTPILRHLITKGGLVCKDCLHMYSLFLFLFHSCLPSFFFSASQSTVRRWLVTYMHNARKACS